jgi:hypothetical protein
MAVTLTREQLSVLVAAQLDSRLRYRCLVLQTGDLSVLAQLCEDGMHALGQLGEPVRVLEYRDQLDEVGALACSRVLTNIEHVAKSGPVLIAGPLHFLDYWSRPVGAAFWEYLASYSLGPGILIADTPREHGLDGVFRLVRTIYGTDVRVFKSRLATAQDGLV